MKKNEFIEKFKKSEATKIIGYQIIKSSTSTTVNYRASCIARSKKEFYSKIFITIEEADETVLWLELLNESGLVPEQKIIPLFNEANEILKVLSTARKNISFT